MDTQLEYVDRLREEARSAWTTSSDPSKRAVLHNLVHELFISDVRAKKVLDELKSVPVATADQRLVNALKIYCDKYVRGRLDSAKNIKSDYLEPSLNMSNHVGFTESKSLLRGSKLVRVLNLSRVQVPLVRHHSSLGKQAPHTKILENGRRIEWHLLPRSHRFGDWLDRAFAPKPGVDGDEIHHKKLVAAELIHFLNKDREERPYEPSWTAFWDDFIRLEGAEPSLADGDAHDWTNAVGVQVELGDWIALLHYDIDSVDQGHGLVRPTQLDAGLYELYFPSPDHQASGGGHPMWLRLQGPSPEPKLLREYIHPSIDHVSGHILDVKKVSNGTDLQNLPEWRRSHHARLSGHYPEVGEWMPDPNQLCPTPAAPTQPNSTAIPG